MSNIKFLKININKKVDTIKQLITDELPKFLGETKLRSYKELQNEAKKKRIKLVKDFLKLLSIEEDSFAEFLVDLTQKLGKCDGVSIQELVLKTLSKPHRNAIENIMLCINQSKSCSEANMYLRMFSGCGYQYSELKEIYNKVVEEKKREFQSIVTYRKVMKEPLELMGVIKKHTRQRFRIPNEEFMKLFVNWLHHNSHYSAFQDYSLGYKKAREACLVIEFPNLTSAYRAFIIDADNKFKDCPEILEGLKDETIEKLSDYVISRKKANDSLKKSGVFEEKLNEEFEEIKKEGGLVSLHNDKEIVDNLLKQREEEVLNKAKTLFCKDKITAEQAEVLIGELKEKNFEKEEEGEGEEEREEGEGEKDKNKKNKEIPEKKNGEKRFCSFSFFRNKFKELGKKFVISKAQTDMCSICLRGYKMVTLLETLQLSLEEEPNNATLKEQIKSVKNQIYLVWLHKQDNKAFRKYFSEQWAHPPKGTVQILADYSEDLAGAMHVQPSQFFYETPSFSFLSIVSRGEINGKVEELRYGGISENKSKNALTSVVGLLKFLKSEEFKCFNAEKLVIRTDGGRPFLNSHFVGTASEILSQNFIISELTEKEGTNSVEFLKKQKQFAQAFYSVCPKLKEIEFVNSIAGHSKSEADQFNSTTKSDLAYQLKVLKEIVSPEQALFALQKQQAERAKLDINSKKEKVKSYVKYVLITKEDFAPHTLNFNKEMNTRISKHIEELERNQLEEKEMGEMEKGKEEKEKEEEVEVEIEEEVEVEMEEEVEVEMEEEREEQERNEKRRNKKFQNKRPERQKRKPIALGDFVVEEFNEEFVQEYSEEYFEEENDESEEESVQKKKKEQTNKQKKKNPNKKNDGKKKKLMKKRKVDRLSNLGRTESEFKEDGETGEIYVLPSTSFDKNVLDNCQSIKFSIASKKNKGKVVFSPTKFSENSLVVSARVKVTDKNFIPVSTKSTHVTFKFDFDKKKTKRVSTEKIILPSHFIASTVVKNIVSKNGNFQHFQQMPSTRRKPGEKGIKHVVFQKDLRREIEENLPLYDSTVSTKVLEQVEIPKETTMIKRKRVDNTTEFFNYTNINLNFQSDDFDQNLEKTFEAELQPTPHRLFATLKCWNNRESVDLNTFKIVIHSIFGGDCQVYMNTEYLEYFKAIKEVGLEENVLILFYADKSLKKTTKLGCVLVSRDTFVLFNPFNDFCLQNIAENLCESFSRKISKSFCLEKSVYEDNFFKLRPQPAIFFLLNKYKTFSNIKPIVCTGYSSSMIEKISNQLLHYKIILNQANSVNKIEIPHSISKTFPAQSPIVTVFNNLIEELNSNRLSYEGVFFVMELFCSSQFLTIEEATNNSNAFSFDQAEPLNIPFYVLENGQNQWTLIQIFPKNKMIKIHYREKFAFDKSVQKVKLLIEKKKMKGFEIKPFVYWPNGFSNSSLDLLFAIVENNVEEDFDGKETDFENFLVKFVHSKCHSLHGFSSENCDICKYGGFFSKKQYLEIFNKIKREELLSQEELLCVLKFYERGALRKVIFYLTNSGDNSLEKEVIIEMRELISKKCICVIFFIEEKGEKVYNCLWIYKGSMSLVDCSENSQAEVLLQAEVIANKISPNKEKPVIEIENVTEYDFKFGYNNSLSYFPLLFYFVKRTSNNHFFYLIETNQFSKYVLSFLHHLLHMQETKFKECRFCGEYPAYFEKLKDNLVKMILEDQFCEDDVKALSECSQTTYPVYSFKQFTSEGFNPLEPKFIVPFFVRNRETKKCWSQFKVDEQLTLFFYGEEISEEVEKVFRKVLSLKIVQNKQSIKVGIGGDGSVFHLIEYSMPWEKSNLSKERRIDLFVNHLKLISNLNDPEEENESQDSESQGVELEGVDIEAELGGVDMGVELEGVDIEAELGVDMGVELGSKNKNDDVTEEQNEEDLKWEEYEEVNVRSLSRFIEETESEEKTQEDSKTSETIINDPTIQSNRTMKFNFKFPEQNLSEFRKFKKRQQHEFEKNITLSPKPTVLEDEIKGFRELGVEKLVTIENRKRKIGESEEIEKENESQEENEKPRKKKKVEKLRKRKIGESEKEIEKEKESEEENEKPRKKKKAEKLRKRKNEETEEEPKQSKKKRKKNPKKKRNHDEMNKDEMSDKTSNDSSSKKRKKSRGRK